jgi:hypothetical protein
VAGKNSTINQDTCKNATITLQVTSDTTFLNTSTSASASAGAPAPTSTSSGLASQATAGVFAAGLGLAIAGLAAL